MNKSSLFQLFRELCALYEMHMRFRIDAF